VIYLLDTNILSESTKPQPDKQVLNWLESVDEDRLFLSVITLAEIQRGISLLDSGKKRDALLAWFNHDLLLRFEGRILSVNQGVALKWGVLMSEVKRAGRAMTALDGLIAATALQENAVLVTRNLKDFAPLGIRLLNPFSSD